MKKTMTYEDYVKNLKEKKEEIPFHKMDDVSRRKFIQGVGLFLAGVGVPSLFRFEKMSMLSRKIFGNSYAFAANPYTDRAIIKLYLRRGFPVSYMGVGNYNTDQSMLNNATDYRNMPWNYSKIVSKPTSGKNVLFTPTGSNLVGREGGVQNAMFAAVGNHTEVFQSCNRSGLFEMMTGRAATEADTSSALLKAGMFFGDTSIVSVLANPATLASNIPIPFSHTIDPSNMFTPPAFTTNKGKALGNTLQTKILATINNKFTGDITSGVLQKDQAGIVNDANQTQTILQNTFTNQLNPNYSGNSAKMTALRTVKIPTNLGQASILNTMDIAEILFVIMQGFELKITPFIGGLVVNTQDWHQSTNPPKSDSATYTLDDRYITGLYLGTAISNLVNNANKWTNPYTGNPLEIMVVVTSEFSRSPLINGEPSNPNNNDGFHTDLLTICSNPSQTHFVPGSWGGVTNDAAGSLMGYNSSGTHSSTIPLMDVNTMFGYQTDLLQIDRTKLGVSATRFPSTASAFLLK